MTYRLHLIHTVVDTDKSVHQTTILDVPFTARGLAKVYRRWQEEVDYIRRVFGPTVLLPKHTFTVHIVREDGSVVTANASPVYEYDQNEDTGEYIERIVGYEAAPINPMDDIDLEKSWGENVESIMTIVRIWDRK